MCYNTPRQLFLSLTEGDLGMITRIVSVLVTIVCVSLVGGSFVWYINLPTVWLNLRGEKICATDSEGKQIPLREVLGQYHVRYAKKCPK